MERAQALELLAESPIIASVKDDKGFAAALKSDVSVMFLLYGNMLTVKDLVQRAHAAGRPYSCT